MSLKRSASDDSNLCQFPFADGRRCRLLRHKRHPSLCLFHQRMEERLLNADELGEFISTSRSGHFDTAADVNRVLGNLFKAIAKNRLPARNAAILSYLGQLLLQSVPMVRHEVINTYGTRGWQAMVYDTLSTEKPVSSGPAPGHSQSVPEDKSISVSKSKPDSAAVTRPKAVRPS